MARHLGFAEYADLHIGLGHYLLQIAEHHLVAVALDHHGFRRARTEETYRRNRQAEYGARVKREFRHVLRYHRHHSRVVRTRRDLAEQHLVARHEQLHAEYAVTAQRIRHPLRDIARLLQCRGVHRLRLPRLAIVAVDLMMAYRFEERRAAAMTHRKQGYLVIELHEALHDNLAASGTAALLSALPSRIGIFERAHDTLAVARRAHDRLHHARNADLMQRLVELRPRRRETVG